MIMNKRWILPALGGLTLILLVIAVAIFIKPSPSKTPSSPPKLEQGSANQGPIISGEGDLYNLLLTQQYFAVSQQLTTYIQTVVGHSVTSAQVTSGSTKVNPDGSVSFSVTTANPPKSFQVVVQKPSADKLIFTVPSTNYSATLYPFGQ